MRTSVEQPRGAGSTTHASAEIIIPNARDDVDDISWRFQVRFQDSSSWLPFDTLTFGPALESTDHAGVRDMSDAYRVPVDFAVNELDEALPDIALTCQDLGAHRLTGVRIEVWPESEPSGDPAVIVTASREAVVAARLGAIAHGVQAANQALATARRRLRGAVLQADLEEKLGRNRIAAEVSGALARRLVLETCAARDLVGDVVKALPQDWRRWAEAPFYWDDIDPLLTQLGPWRYGHVGLCISDNSQVAFWVGCRDYDPNDHYDRVDQLSDELSELRGSLTDVEERDRESEIALEVARADRARQIAAESAYRSLRQAGLMLTADGSSPASLEDLKETSGPGNSLSVRRILGDR